MLYIILGCVLGIALTLFLVFIFHYLKRIDDNDKFKILKKKKNGGQRQIDPNMSLDDFDLDIDEPPKQPIIEEEGEEAGGEGEPS